MSYTSARVGPRQWKVLLAVDAVWPESVSAKTAGQSISDGLPFSAHKPVIDGLIVKGLLEHVDDPAGSLLWPHCLVRITERGAWARASKATRAANPA